MMSEGMGLNGMILEKLFQIWKNVFHKYEVDKFEFKLTCLVSALRRSENFKLRAFVEVN